MNIEDFFEQTDFPKATYEVETTKEEMINSIIAKLPTLSKERVRVVQTLIDSY